MNIRVDLNTSIFDGTEVVFRSPVDCSQVTGLKVYYPDGSQEFAFADAHGNNVGDIDHLFAENVAVKVILDVTTGMAFVQNADTNAYIERTFVKTVNGATPDENGNVEVAGGGATGSVTHADFKYVTGHIETVKSTETKITKFIYTRNISARERLSFFIHDFTHLKKVEFYIRTGDGTQEKIGGCLCAEHPNYWINLEAYSEDVMFRIYATVSDDIGSNTAYFTVSVYENRDGNLNQRLLTVEQENVVQNESIAKCEKNVERFISRNIYCGEVTDGGYYDDGGVWVTSNSFRCAVLPVNSVVNGDRIIYSQEFAYYNGQFRFDAFSEDGTWLGKIYNGKNTSFIVNGVQSNKFYLVIRIGAKKDVSNLFVAIDGNIKSAVLKGKTINCLGDSFTAPVNGWHKHLAERTGIVCNNYGVASSRITIDSGEAGSFLNRYQNMDNTADVTIIFGGINDSRSMFDDGVNDTIQLGSMDSDLDNTTFYGGLRLLIESIKAFMPGKKILGVIPPDFEQTTPYLTYLPQVRTACREVFEYYGIPYADLKKNCQEMYVDDYNFLTYRNGSANDYHPSIAGHVAISEVIQGALEKYIKV